MITIRGQLLVLLWLLLTALIALTGYWNYQNTRTELVNLFDSHLIYTGLALQELHQQLKAEPEPSLEGALLESVMNPSRSRFTKLPHALPDYFLTHQLPQVFQIWSADHTRLIEKSKHAPTQPLTAYEPGLSSVNLSPDSSWRIFTLVDMQGTIYVVAEPAHIRSMLVDNIALAQSVPMACLWVALLLLSGWTIRWTLKPLEKISQELSERHLDYLHPINPENIPIEMKPVVMQFNHLLERVEDGVAREKRFTADASHELRTPLAALQIQAQVAMSAGDNANGNKQRQQALKNMMLGVERCTHVIHQLGILAKIRPQEPLREVTDINLAMVAAEVVGELAPIAVEKNIDIHFDKVNMDKNSTIRGNLTLIRIMMRNIIDNAIRYTEPNHAVSVQTFIKDNSCIFRVVDQGPGIPPELHKRVFERFYRGLGHDATGSGLGLSIVDQIVALHHARITLDTPPEGGLCFDVAFPIPTP